MKTFVIQMIILIILLFAGMYFVFNKQGLAQFNLMPTPQAGLKISNTLVNIEIVDNKAKRAKGLSGRDSLATDSGMLFIFEEADRHRFWMKGMRIPLDIVWLKEKRVVELLKNVQPPSEDQLDKDLAIYAPKVEIDSVLELNSGFIDERNVKLGDTIELFSLE